jgi:hypothetical protein
MISRLPTPSLYSGLLEHLVHQLFSLSTIVEVHPQQEHSPRVITPINSPILFYAKHLWQYDRKQIQLYLHSQ